MLVHRTEYLPSLTRPPFSTAFNTPRPPGILTNGVREIPANVREYPEDLYDALQVGFEQAMIRNPEERHETWIYLGGVDILFVIF